MNKQDWVWMPHAGHFVGAWDCQFRMNTYVGNYIVSTVGDYHPKGEHGTRSHIGHNRLYETMVFKAKGSGEKCCPWEALDGQAIDFEGYNNPGKASEGHMRMCEKWAKHEH